MPRIHINKRLLPGSKIALPDEAAHYVNRVLRRGVGDTIELFNSQDGEFACTILELQGTHGTIRVDKAVGAATESPLHTTLVQGLCRSQRMDYCVQKATELGVTRILPVITERCVVRLDKARAAKRLAHWQAVSTSACEQSRRTSVPQIELPIPFRELLARDDLGDRIVFDPEEGLPFSRWPNKLTRLSLFIGPEGGLSGEEVGALVGSDALRLRMGPRIFRTETAGVVALALAQARWGDLG